MQFHLPAVRENDEDLAYTGPVTPFARKIFSEKYAQPGETFRDVVTRIANRLSDNTDHFRALRSILAHQRFLPGGRIQTAVGSTRNTTPYNCFVSGTIDDSYTDGQGSIMDRAKQAAMTMRLGGGIGYDFSTLRPRGELIRKLGSKSSGPISFMEIFDAVCRATCSAGHRRGAQMGILRVDHPDVEEFVRSKQNNTYLQGFNISLAITDEFMTAVELNTSFDLKWNNRVYRSIRARDLWDSIMRSTWDWGDPGVIFIDTINQQNNLSYCETIAATNPCGEQPLPPFGACLLGSFNLTKYIVAKGNTFSFNYNQLSLDIPHVVAAMDNVVDVADYPLFEQEREAKLKRRMGLGVTGAANAIEALGHPYGSPAFCEHLGLILRFIRDHSYRASALRAAEKGAFPAYSAREYMSAPFVQQLPAEIIDLIYDHGMRNSHLLSIAPTGTISLVADNISGAIEPVYHHVLNRTIIEQDGPKQYQLVDYGLKVFGVRGKTAEECTVDDHLNVLITASRYVDSAVSKTCNVGDNVSYEDFKKIYHRAWRGHCKGCTTFRASGLKMGILQAVKEPAPEAATIESLGSCSVDPVTGRKSCE